MTVKEYNEVIYPLINNSFVFLHGLEHNIKKADSPERAIRNLQILGWGPELAKFLCDAVSAYQEILVEQVRSDSLAVANEAKEACSPSFAPEDNNYEAGGDKK